MDIATLSLVKYTQTHVHTRTHTTTHMHTHKNTHAHEHTYTRTYQPAYAWVCLIRVHVLLPYTYICTHVCAPIPVRCCSRACPPHGLLSQKALSPCRLLPDTLLGCCPLPSVVWCCHWPIVRQNVSVCMCKAWLVDIQEDWLLSLTTQHIHTYLITCIHMYTHTHTPFFSQSPIIIIWKP